MRTAVIATLAVFVATLAVASAYSLTLEQESMLFNAFVREHSKAYKTASEQLHRFGVFRENLRYISEFNKGNHGYELAMNHFGDLTFEEFRDTYLSRKDAPRYSDLLSSSRVGVHDTEADPATAPTSIDWRAKGKVTRVKNQGSCGSCWAFSAVGAVEGAHAIKSGSLVELSEQNLVSCSKNGGNAGCNGGLMQSAFDYIVKNGGIDTESCYPYTGKDSACAYKSTCKGAIITGHVDVRSGCETCLEDAVALGPVSVSISASSSAFQFYSKGVFSSATCPNRMNDLDHGVLAVGYGSENGVPYWIVKNSWGASWGESGYIRMKRGVNQCGIALDNSYPKV